MEDAQKRPVVWHAEPVALVAARLDSDLQRGLTSHQATARLAKYGRNELAVQGVTPWTMVLIRQFWDVLTLILLVAAALSALVGERVDAITILAIVCLNALLGFIQEWRAERALVALRRMLAPTCTVIRGDGEQTLSTKDLVPGDLVVVATGDRVPADLRITTANNLRVDESALTGESDSVAKQTEAMDADTPLAEQSCMTWMGTVVTSGRGLGLVVTTGLETQFGQISQLTETVQAESTPLQRKMAILGRQLGIAAVTIAIVISVIGWWLGNGLREMFMVGVSLAVAAVPEGLPAVVTMTMALGVRAMVRQRALLRRLQAAESLGAATVICTDKTGTLTQNQMTVTRIWLPTGEVSVTGVGYEPTGLFKRDDQELNDQEEPELMQLLQSAMLCNHASLHRTKQGWEGVGEPTEGALMVAAYKAHLPAVDHDNDLTEFAFDSTRKRMTIVRRDPEGLVAHVKGAPEVIFERCHKIQVESAERSLTADDVRRAEAAIEKFASEGLRTLAIARRPLPQDAGMEADEVEDRLTLLGIVGMLDPPRPEVPKAIQKAKQAGIRVVMITGDAAPTAVAIANRVGLHVKQAMTGKELDDISEETLLSRLRTDAVFARTTPEHKLRIVTALQRDGHVVAMTGDGVNDAPALKKADIGIAMGIRGTDVAKGASDMILMDDNFSSIVGAVEEGRRQYDNIQKFVRYLLSSNIGEVIAVVCSIVMGGPLILLPVQILWMNLVTDGLSAIALGVEPAEPNVMERPPREVNGRVIDREGLWMILVLGGYVGLASLGLFLAYLASRDASQQAVAQTVAFTGIIVIQKLNVLNFRFLSTPMRWSLFWSNPWVLLAIAGSLLLQLAALHVPILQRMLHTQPIGWREWGMIFVVAAPVFLITELVKRWRGAVRETPR